MPLLLRWTLLAALSLALGTPMQAEGVAAASQTQTAPDDLAYLTQLSLVESQLLAAATLYQNGMKEAAIGLSYQPQTEVTGPLRPMLAAHGIADFTPLMIAFSAAMEAGEPQLAIDAALEKVRAAIDTAQAVDADALPLRFAALTALTHAAAVGYASSLTDGKVADLAAYHCAHADILVARDLATELQRPAEPQSTRILTALKAADAAFGDLTSPDPQAGDPAILTKVAADVAQISATLP
ncbi:MAG: hypothetical protein ACOH2M_12480 [Cypionkella sp.]